MWLYFIDSQPGMYTTDHADTVPTGHTIGNQPGEVNSRPTYMADLRFSVTNLRTTVAIVT